MTTLPLPALVGLDPAIQALLLLAAEPRLGGVVLAAPAGTGKSALARGLHALLPDSAPFVEVPAGADAEALLGGIDMEATLRTGRRVARQGLLARAHGGALCVDELNLLDDASANLLLAALDSGAVHVEREGISERSPARFALVGAYDPAEGTPRAHLLDRVALLVTLPAAFAPKDRAEVVRRNLTRDARRETRDGSGQSSIVNRQWDDELALMQAMVLAAREPLPAVTLAPEQIGYLVGAALAFGVQGQRADLFASYAACAAAALDGRDLVTQDDLDLAVRLVIVPRATRMPELESTEHRAQSAEQPQTEPSPPQTEQNEQDTQHSTLTPQHLEEQVFAALAADLPADLTALPFRALRHGRSGSRGATSGTRGRHVRSAPGDPRRSRVDVPATLRAAAPWQRLRRGEGERGRGGEGERGSRTGEAFARPAPRDAQSPANASPHTPTPPHLHTSTPPHLHLRSEDLRVKQYRSKAGALFCFAVDASGSMALNRMRQAKGAVHALLQQAYVHRDRVALLAFRGQRAELLLPPSQSVELARRALDLLPTGGGTPLASALLVALDVARQARAKGILQTVLVLLTDGRANMGLRADRAGVDAELQALGRSVAAAGITALVIDTQRSYLSRGEAGRLAGWLGGQYVYLPGASGEQIAQATQKTIGR